MSWNERRVRAERWLEGRMLAFSRSVQRNWVLTALGLTALGVGGAGVVALVSSGSRWNAVGIYETCLATGLTIAIFVWTLSGMTLRLSEESRLGAEGFAREVTAIGSFRQTQMTSAERRALMAALGLGSEGEVDDAVALWLKAATDGKQGGRPLLVITKDLRFLRVTSNAGYKVKDLATGSTLPS